MFLWVFAIHTIVEVIDRPHTFVEISHLRDNFIGQSMAPNPSGTNILGYVNTRQIITWLRPLNSKVSDQSGVAANEAVLCTACTGLIAIVDVLVFFISIVSIAIGRFGSKESLGK